MANADNDEELTAQEVFGQEAIRREGTEQEGISNRGKAAEEPGQEFVLDMVAEMERRGMRDDLKSDDRLAVVRGHEDAEWQAGRNFVPDTTEGDIRAQQGRPTDR